jgi:hypothetical protein
VRLSFPRNVRADRFDHTQFPDQFWGKLRKLKEVVIHYLIKTFTSRYSKLRT